MFDLVLNYIIGLKKEEPRAGKRKPIEESDDEEKGKEGETQGAGATMGDQMAAGGDPTQSMPT